MNIRPAASADHAEWLRMRMALWPDCPIEQLEREMAMIESDPQQTAFVAAPNDGPPCGLVEVSIHPNAIGCRTQPVGYVEGWYVDPEARRRGLGRQLLDAAEAWARSHGCHEMASDTQLDNAVSFAAHRAAGYEETDRAIHFRKPLD